MNSFKLLPPIQTMWNGERFERSSSGRTLLCSAGIDSLNDILFKDFGPPITKSSVSTTVRIKVQSPTESSGVYIKREFARAKRLLRPGRLARERQSLIYLQSIGVPTPEWIGFGERWSRGRVSHSALLLREIPGAVNLVQFFQNIVPNMDPDERDQAVAQLLDRLANQLATAHKSGFLHRDLSWRNILVKRTTTDWETLWIDSPRGIRVPLLTARMRHHELARCDRTSTLFLTEDDRLRFYSRYQLHYDNRAPDQRYWNAIRLDSTSRSIPGAEIRSGRRQTFQAQSIEAMRQERW